MADEKKPDKIVTIDELGKKHIKFVVEFPNLAAQIPKLGK